MAEWRRREFVQLSSLPFLLLQTLFLSCVFSHTIAGLACSQNHLDEQLVMIVSTSYLFIDRQPHVAQAGLNYVVNDDPELLILLFPSSEVGSQGGATMLSLYCPRDEAQVFVHARQVCCQLSPIPNLCLFNYVYIL